MISFNFQVCYAQLTVTTGIQDKYIIIIFTGSMVRPVNHFIYLMFYILHLFTVLISNTVKCKYHPGTF